MHKCLKPFLWAKFKTRRPNDASSPWEDKISHQERYDIILYLWFNDKDICCSLCAFEVIRTWSHCIVKCCYWLFCFVLKAYRSRPVLPLFSQIRTVTVALWKSNPGRTLNGWLTLHAVISDTKARGFWGFEEGWHIWQHQWWPPVYSYQ